MKAKTMFCLLIAFITLSAHAQEKGPVAISPGSDEGIARVGVNCPTFSWAATEWASGYKVVVFETNGPNILSYEEIAAISSPVLDKEIQGRALSWTPSSDERLSNRSMYVWYVQAVDGYGTGIWSEGRMFKVEGEVQLVGMGDKLKESLKERGVSESVIEDVLEDMRLGMKEVVAYGVNTDSGDVSAQDKVGIQGLEGATNTFYGLDAGFSITSGNFNTFIGRSAGYDNTTAGYNTYVGYYAGSDNTSGAHNTFIGTNAGLSNTTGYSNTFIGSGAGYSNSTSHYNTFLGQAAGYYNTTGNNNIFIGLSAGVSNTIGSSNTFMGQSAGYSNTEGSYNTFIGNLAGYNNITGNNNVFLGYMAGYNETGSSILYIENSDSSSPLIWGDFENDILAVNGQMCIGTTSSAYAMELETTGENAAFVAQRTDGATNYINATAGFGNFGTVTNHPLRLAVNSAWRMRLDNDNSLTMANGAMCTAGGTWQNYSRREAKENIHDLTTDEAMDTLKGLVAVKYNYKVDKEEKHVGFIAEDVPELVASKDRNGISSMDIVAVLTKVVQEQQRLAEEQQKTIDKLQKQIDELKSKEK